MMFLSAGLMFLLIEDSSRNAVRANRPNNMVPNIGGDKTMAPTNADKIHQEFVLVSISFTKCEGLYFFQIVKRSVAKHKINSTTAKVLCTMLF